MTTKRLFLSNRKRASSLARRVFDDDDVSPKTLCFGVVDFDGKSGGRKHDAFGGRHAWWEYDVFIVQQRSHTQRRRL